MSESAYKPPEPCDDELDELARSIRAELRGIGFAPAFDPPAEGVVDARKRLAEAERRRVRMARNLLNYLAPMILVVGLGLALRLLLPEL